MKRFFFQLIHCMGELLFYYYIVFVQLQGFRFLHNLYKFWDAYISYAHYFTKNVYEFEIRNTYNQIKMFTTLKFYNFLFLILRTSSALNEKTKTEYSLYISQLLTISYFALEFQHFFFLSQSLLR